MVCVLITITQPSQTANIYIHGKQTVKWVKWQLKVTCSPPKPNLFSMKTILQALTRP